MKNVIWIVAVLLTAAASWSLNEVLSPGPGSPVTDTASGAAYEELQKENEDLVRKANGQAGTIQNLLAKIEGLENRPPRTITVFDTTVIIDTLPVFLSVGVTGGGSTLEGLAASAEDTAGERTPSKVTYDIRGCDTWFTRADGTLVCNRPRLGHLRLGAQLAGRWKGNSYVPLPDAALSASWTPYNLSPWTIRAEWWASDPERIRAGVEYQLKIF